MINIITCLGCLFVVKAATSTWDACAILGWHNHMPRSCVHDHGKILWGVTKTYIPRICGLVRNYLLTSFDGHNLPLQLHNKWTLRINFYYLKQQHASHECFKR